MAKPFNRLVIVAGEESGDIHAAAFITQLVAKHPQLAISGIGGQHMQAAGAELLMNLAQYGVTGLTEVLSHCNTIRKAFVCIKNHLVQHPPDLLVLVDYPGFNLRLARFAKEKLGLKILYYISPQIWAWKANRIHKIKRYVDTMAVILPFEKAIYEKAQVPVRFVGHPLVEKMGQVVETSASRKTLHLAMDAKIIALLPGSRNNEIKKHMPILVDTARLLLAQNPNLQFIIPVAQTMSPETIASYCHPSLPIITIQGKALDCMNAADCVIVASGTASLECALLEKPMCIIYKSSFISYYLAMKVIKVRFLGLCNLLTNKMLVPEFLQHDCNAKELSQFVSNLLQDETRAQKMKQDFASLTASLSLKKADCSIADLIESELPELNA